ncbi:hypothetical protein EV121DRAFT_270319 [Schizophyllum commune]
MAEVPIHGVKVTLESFIPQRGRHSAEIKIDMGLTIPLSFEDMCKNIVLSLAQRALNEQTGRVPLRTLTVRVDLPLRKGRWILDWLTHALCDSVIYWDTLKIITPFYELSTADGKDEALQKKLREEEQRFSPLAFEHLANTQLIYEGADENVPWPWLSIDGLSRFQVRALKLEQRVSTTQYVGLVQHAISDTVNPATDPRLKLRIGGLMLPDSDPAAAGNAPDPRGAPQRLTALNLGRLSAGVRLQDAVHAGGAHESITKLTVDVSASLTTDGAEGDGTTASIEGALRACGKLQTVKVRCKEEHAEGLKTALSSWMGLGQAEERAMPNGEREIVASKKLH